MEHLALPKAHRNVEDEHRKAAWRILTGSVSPERYPAVIEAMEEALAHWQAYRDDVAKACGIAKGEDGQPRLAR